MPVWVAESTAEDEAEVSLMVHRVSVLHTGMHVIAEISNAFATCHINVIALVGNYFRVKCTSAKRVESFAYTNWTTEPSGQTHTRDLSITRELDLW